MLRTKLVIALIVAAIGGTSPWTADAGAGCCALCGRECQSAQVCRQVDDKRKLTETCWGLKEEDFCLPGPSTPGCRHCEDICESDGCCLHGRPRALVWIDWLHSDRATLFTRKKLMKRTVTKTVPSRKWVVEDLCPACKASVQQP